MNEPYSEVQFKEKFEVMIAGKSIGSFNEYRDAITFSHGWNEAVDTIAIFIHGKGIDADFSTLGDVDPAVVVWNGSCLQIGYEVTEVTS